MKTKHHLSFLCGGVVFRVLNLRTKNLNQLHMLLSQVELAGNVCNRLC